VRPLKLTIQGFGPFREKQEVLFHEEADFLLITGKTGSGKTTIFDAIMFALYGRLPGTREENSIVCSLLEAGEVPFVELEFLIRGKVYRVYRQPAYIRPSLRKKNSFTREQAMVQLLVREKEEWASSEGTITEINEFLQEILRLSEDEFSRIVLLPQGEFQKFLMAETQEKRALLQKIFPTEKHESVAAMAKEMKNARQHELKALKDQLDVLLEEFDPDGFDDEERKRKAEKTAEENACKTLQKDLEEQKVLIAENQKIFDDFLLLDKKTSEAKGLSNRAAEIAETEVQLKKGREGELLFPVLDEHVRLKETLDVALQSIDETEKNRKESEKSLIHFEKAYLKLPVVEEKLLQKRELLSVLKNLLPKAEEFKKKNEMLAGQLEFGKKLKSIHDNLRKAENSLESQISSLKEYLKDQQKNDEKIKENLLDLAGLRETLKQARDLEELQEKLTISKTELSSKEKLLAVNSETVSCNEKKVAGLKKKHDAAAAAHLASDLREGVPCPVCGSLSHPRPAEVDDAGFRETEQLEAAENNLRLSLNEEVRLTEIIKQLKTQIASLEKDKAYGSTKETASALFEKIQFMEKESVFLEKESREMHKKREELNDLEKKIAPIREELKDQQNGLLAARADYTEVKTEVDLLKKELGKHSDVNGEIKALKEKIKEEENAILAARKNFQDGEKLLKEINGRLAVQKEEAKKSKITLDSRHKNLLKRIEKTSFQSIEELEALRKINLPLENLENKINQYREAVTTVHADITALKKRVVGKKRPDTALMQKAYDTLSKELSVREEKRRGADIALRDIQENKKSFKRLKKDIGSKSKNADMLIELADDLNGKNSKNINFQNFILGAYLREVTRYATERFSRMSSGRYSICVNEEIEHRGRQTGLELDVFDAFSGKLRSVKTLSGGEKFLAAISLSLGLADVIQERSGGIELDAIFIDEGFGSLDEESLDLALTILDEIRHNRLVGIISHVAELRNRIPGQLQVVKEASGSQIVS